MGRSTYVFDRRTALAGLAACALAGCRGGDRAAPAPSAGALQPATPAPQPATPAPSPSPVPPKVSSAVAVKWSELATEAMLADTRAQPPGLSPMEQSRILAMAFIAGHDALNNIQRFSTPYALVDDVYPAAKPMQTYEMAVCTVLQALMPAHAAAFEEALWTSLSPSGVKIYGDEWFLGKEAAEAVFSRRANDGAADAQGPYTPGTAPGDYQPTPPVGVATFVNWGRVKPFVLKSGDQFRAPPPPDVLSQAYADDFNEVKSLGAAVGSTRTAEQSEIAKFWLESTPLSWQRIAAHKYGPESWSLWDSARLFARLQMAQADAYIACLESKYHYNFWRPITAIRNADSDGNLATVADPGWEPFDPVTPQVPEYPSAHAAAATAGAAILYLAVNTGTGLTYQSSTASAPRNFATPYYFADDAPTGQDLWSNIAGEIGLSRIYVGYHFRHAVEAGWTMGRSVAEWVQLHGLAL